MAPLTHQPLPMLRSLKWHRAMIIRVRETKQGELIDFASPAAPYVDILFWDKLAPLFLAYWVPDLHTGHFARTELKDIGTRILNFQRLKGCPLQVPHHSGRKASLPRGSYLPTGWAFFFFFFTRLPGQGNVLPCQSAIPVIISHLNLERRHRSPRHRLKMLRP